MFSLGIWPGHLTRPAHRLPIAAYTAAACGDRTGRADRAGTRLPAACPAFMFASPLGSRGCFPFEPAARLSLVHLHCTTAGPAGWSAGALTRGISARLPFWNFLLPRVTSLHGIWSVWTLERAVQCWGAALTHAGAAMLGLHVGVQRAPRAPRACNCPTDTRRTQAQ